MRRGGTSLLLAVVTLLIAMPVAGDGWAAAFRSSAADSALRFEDLIVTRQGSGRGLVTYFRLNHRLPYAPRGLYEGEEPGGVRLYAAYLRAAGYYHEGTLESISDVSSRYCYVEQAEIGPHEHQPRVGEVVSVSLVVHGRTVLRARARVHTRKLGPRVRNRQGVIIDMVDLPYEEALGCAKQASHH
jgi:hypothetical protein